MQADVILTNPSGPTGETVARSLQNRGLRVVIMEAPNARKMEDSYIARLHKFVAEYHPQTVWPIFFGDVLARHRDEFPSVDLPLSSAEKILQLDNKLQCCDLAESLGIRQPRRFRSVGEVLEAGSRGDAGYGPDGAGAAAGSVSGFSGGGAAESSLHGDAGGVFPVVFKRAMGLGGDSVYFPGNERALRNLVRSCGPAGDSAGTGVRSGAGDDSLSGAGGADIRSDTDSADPQRDADSATVTGALITEFIPGEDVSVDAIRWGGYYYGAAYRVLEPRRKGVSLRRVSILAPDLVATLRRILDAVGYQGVCGADFRVAADGTAYFLECNPRFSGGLESAIASGFDIPWVYWQLTHGIEPDPVAFTPGIITGMEI